MPGARLHADTPHGPPLLTGLNPTVYWCTNQPSPVRREWEVDGRDIICGVGINHFIAYIQII